MNKITPELKKNFSFAEKLFSQGKYHEAIEKYKKILTEHPKTIQAINNIGLSYECLNKLDEAVEYYRKCSVMFPKEIIFLNNLANIYYKKKDYDNALKEMTKSLLIDNSQQKIIERKAISLVGMNLINQVNLFLKTYLKKIPNNLLLNTLYGKNLITLNQHKKGLKYLKKGTGFIEFNENKVNLV